MFGVAEHPQGFLAHAVGDVANGSERPRRGERIAHSRQCASPSRPLGQELLHECSLASPRFADHHHKYAFSGQGTVGAGGQNRQFRVTFDQLHAADGSGSQGAEQGKGRNASDIGTAMGTQNIGSFYRCLAMQQAAIL